MQDQYGVGRPEIHQELAMVVSNTISDPDFCVVSTASSVTIQPRTVSKGNAFLKLLQMMDVNREDIFVVGLGDADNDVGIFEESDLSVGVHERVFNLTDLSSTLGTLASKQVISMICKVNA